MAHEGHTDGRKTRKRGKGRCTQAWSVHGDGGQVPINRLGLTDLRQEACLWVDGSGSEGSKSVGAVTLANI